VRVPLNKPECSSTMEGKPKDKVNTLPLPDLMLCT
jgi:hypothetical protein